MASGIALESNFVFSDGGRCRYVGKGKPFKSYQADDCVIRAVCNATGMDYKEAYDALFAITRKHGYSPNQGVTKADIRKFIEKMLGWEWHPLMGIGTGCQVHLRKSELPRGVVILSCSEHLTCSKDGVIYDTYDCSRDGRRCVYGYWSAPKK